MYLVISQWEPLPGQEAQFETLSRKLAATLRKQKGVLLLETITVGKGHFTVHGYRDETTYRALVDNPKSEFSKALQEHDIEKVARWIGSQRGQTLPHEG